MRPSPLFHFLHGTSTDLFSRCSDIKKYYTLGKEEFPSDVALSRLGERDESERYNYGKKSFNPMYLIKNTADPRKLEMCVLLSPLLFAPSCLPFLSLQVLRLLRLPVPARPHQALRGSHLSGALSAPVFDVLPPADPLLPSQTIFLNTEHRKYWSNDEIDESKIVRIDWWYQLCHSWVRSIFHLFPSTILTPSSFLADPLRLRRPLDVPPPGLQPRPLQCCLDPRQRSVRPLSVSALVRTALLTSLLTPSEVAVMSGMAAAHDLGAAYPEELEQDDFALLCFRLCTFRFPLPAPLPG